MYKSNLNNRSLRAVLLLGAAIGMVGYAGAALADDQAVETVTVTGSMLPQLNFQTPAPVEVFSAQDIENSGITNTTDLLRSVAANGSGSLPNSFGEAFASGASNISLRGLFSNSTLVLINGQRTVDYPLADDGTRSFVDLNTLPEHAIDHIEILKDGASSVYGADAVAGVVNIILKNEFQGVEADANVGTSQHGGGQSEHFGGTIGYGDLSTDRYNVFLDFEWEHDDDIKVGQRGYPFNQEPLFTGTNFSSYPGYGNLLGCATGPTGCNTLGGPGAVEFSPAVTGTVGPVLIADPTFATNYNAPTVLGPTQPLSTSGACASGSALGTDNPVNPFGGTYCYSNNGLKGVDQPTMNRFNLYAHATMKLWSGATGTLDTSYDESDVFASSFPQTPQSSTPVNTSELALPAYLSNGDANPNDPFVYGNPACAQAGQTEATGHSATCPDASISTILPMHTGIATQSHVLRSTATIKGEYSGWDYTLTALAAHSWLYDNSYGFVSLPVELADVENGTWNFVNQSANSKAAMNALAPPITTVSTNDLELFDAHVDRELFDLPGGPVEFGIGATARHEQTFAPNSNPNLQQGLGEAQTIGSRNVFSGYTEVSLPILKSLEADISARYDHYTDAGDTLNPKVGIKWTPIDEVMLRGTYSTGFVAPSFAQSSSNSITQGFQAPYGPINTLEANGVTAKNMCAFISQHGGTCDASYNITNPGDPYVNSPYSLGQETTGNPEIKPIHSKSYTAGAVVTPFDDIDLTGSVDYYWIQETGVIWGPSTGTAVVDYLNGVPQPSGVTIKYDGPDPLYPNAPLRPINIIGLYQNSNKIDTSGLDFEVKGGADLFDSGIHYSTDLNLSRILDFNTWWNGQPKTDWAGTMAPTDDNSGSGTPKWQWTWANTFTFGDFSTTFTGYYHSHIRQYIADVGDNFCVSPYIVGFGFGGLTGNGNNCYSKSFVDVDWTVRYNVTDSVQVNGTIRNVLDSKPPINPLGAGPTMNDGSIDQMGIVGRYFEVGVKVKT